MTTKQLPKQSIWRTVLGYLAAGGKLTPELEEAALKYAGIATITNPEVRAALVEAEAKLTEAIANQRAADTAVVLKQTAPDAPPSATDLKLAADKVKSAEERRAIAERKVLAVNDAEKYLGREASAELQHPRTLAAIEHNYNGLYSAVYDDPGEDTYRAAEARRAAALSGLPTLRTIYAAAVAPGAKPKELKALKLLWQAFPARMPTLADARIDETKAADKVTEERAERDALAARERVANETNAALAAQGRSGSTKTVNDGGK